MDVYFCSERLRSRRKELGFTQEFLAELCGCSPRYLRNLETGKQRNPSANLVRRMTFVLKITAEDLLVVRDEDWSWAREALAGRWFRKD